MSSTVVRRIRCQLCVLMIYLLQVITLSLTITTIIYPNTECFHHNEGVDTVARPVIAIYFPFLDLARITRLLSSG